MKSDINGCKVEYVRKGRLYFARVPQTTRQFLGVGKTKTEAYRDARDSVRRINRSC